MENINNTMEIATEAMENTATVVGSNLSTIEKIGVAGGITFLLTLAGVGVKKFVIDPIANKIKAGKDKANTEAEQKKPDSKYVEVKRTTEETDKE